MNSEERFWGRIEKRGPDACWLWPGAVLNSGYGAFTRNRSGLEGPRQVTAHRFACEAAHGPVPAGLHVLHRCDNKLCVNPAHLYAGTHQQNVADAKARHRYVSTNARLTPAQVLAIRASGAKGCVEARRYGVTPSAISNIRSGKRWADLSTETI